MSEASSESTREPSPEQRISSLVVQLLRAYTGRGPTKAWTTTADNLVTVVLYDTLTKGERSLVAEGRVELVLSTRKAYQQTMREELVAGICEITGQVVIAFLSDNHIDPDIAVEIFVLGSPPAEPNVLQAL